MDAPIPQPTLTGTLVELRPWRSSIRRRRRCRVSRLKVVDSVKMPGSAQNASVVPVSCVAAPRSSGSGTLRT